MLVVSTSGVKVCTDLRGHRVWLQESSLGDTEHMCACMELVLLRGKWSVRGHRNQGDRKKSGLERNDSLLTRNTLLWVVKRI